MVTVTAPVAGTLSGVSAAAAWCARDARRPADEARADHPGRTRSEHRSAARRRGRAGRADTGSATAAAARAAAEGRRRQRAQRRRGARAAAGGRSRAERRARATDRHAAGTGRGPGELAITAPFDGVVQSVSAAAGQTVAASAPLAEIAQVTTLWVRVPLYAGDLERHRPAQPASVTRLGGRDSRDRRRRVTAPLKADPTAASVDLFYELSADATSHCGQGERVIVELPLRSTLAGPRRAGAAVLYDIHGGAWVYEDPARNAYARRRVEIARTPATARSSRAASPGRRSSPPAPRSSSAPSSTRASRHAALARLALAAPRIVVVALAVLLVGRRPSRDAADDAARRLPRVRAAAGRDPDRGAGPLDRRGRSLVTRAARERAERRARPRDASARSRCSACRRSC